MGQLLEGGMQSEVKIQGCKNFLISYVSEIVFKYVLIMSEDIFRDILI